MCLSVTNRANKTTVILSKNLNKMFTNFQWTSVVVLILWFQSGDSRNLNPKNLSPVILVPGLGGSQLEAKLNKTSAPFFWCDTRKSQYFKIWINPMTTFPLECWIDNVKLKYDNVSRRSENMPGVDIRASGWGKSESVEWLGESLGAYFFYIANALVRNGYVRGESLFGAPYDFRKGPNDNKLWFEDFKELIELAYEQNNKISVTLIGHSMGGRMILAFLQQMTQAWKDQYIKQVITLAVPWGGSVRTVQALSVGYDLNLWFIPQFYMESMQRTFASLVWLLPSKLFWHRDEVLITSGHRNYTQQTIDEFFNDIGNVNVAEIRKDQDHYDNFTAPGVDMHCLYGSGVKTIERLDFGNKFNKFPTIIEGDGDGHVNIRSLIGCKYWENTTAQRNHNIYQQEFPETNHLNILDNHDAMNYILKTLGRI